jgi:uncharacterized FAD-dependent dehydrogenase
MVVEIRPEDIHDASFQEVISNYYKNESICSEAEQQMHEEVQRQLAADALHPLALLELQDALEAACWQQGNMRQTAPSQRMVDFTRKKLSYDLPESSYAPGLVSSPLHFWMPHFISDRLSLGFQQFGRSSKGFLTNDAVMIGVETRTSSPVRILRNNETLQHVTVSGLFPCGEGAGYAGGIVSAGVDGERCAEAAALYVEQTTQR